MVNYSEIQWIINCWFTDGSNVDDNKDCVPNTSLWWHGLELAPSFHKTALISRIWEKPKESKAKVNCKFTSSFTFFNTWR